jgi:hypothetical protein
VTHIPILTGPVPNENPDTRDRADRAAGLPTVHEVDRELDRRDEENAQRGREL